MEQQTILVRASDIDDEILERLERKPAPSEMLAVTIEPATARQQRQEAVKRFRALAKEASKKAWDNGMTASESADIEREAFREKSH